MPYLNIEIHGVAVTEEQAITITTNMTRIMAETASKKAELTSVRIGQPSAAAWSIGGQLSPTAARAHMDIHITRDTNTAEEIAELVRLGHAALETAFGAMPVATYVIVHEHNAGNWGYGGQTQKARAKNAMAVS